MTRWNELGGYPVEQHNSPNRGGAMDDHLGVVCHVAEGTYRGTISWQLNPDQRYSSGQSVTTCSTWIVGRNRGEIAQMVDTDQIAWCQRGGSRTWLSIEFAGYHTQALTAWQIEAAALILAAVHERYGVPLQVAPDPSVRGLGHHSMDREWKGEEWGHEDCPGPQIIAQKPQIVARATQLVNGADMTPEQDSQVIAGQRTPRNALYYFLEGIATGKIPTTRPKEQGGGFDWTKMVDAPWPGLKQIGERLAALEAKPNADVDEEALAAALAAALAPLLPDGTDPAEIAAIVRAQLDQTRLVGA